MQQEIQFSGFSRETFKFMRGLSKNNNVKWFNEHREMYEQHLVKPARELVTSIREFVHFLNPGFETEPKFNKSLVRINRDMRFAKGNPYKDYFLIRFGRFKWDSELFLFVSADGVEVGMFINNDRRDDSCRFHSNVSARPEEFIEICKRYRVGRKYAVYELKREVEIISRHFDPEKDWKKIINLPMIIVSRDYLPENRIVCSPDFIIEVMDIFSRLYPFWIFSTSVSLLKDLEMYEERVGVMEGTRVTR